MGMDPIAEGEMYEVTIQVDGPLNRQDFRKFRAELMEFLDKFSGKPAVPAQGGNPATAAVAGIDNSHKKFDSPTTPPPAGWKRPLIQVREARGGQRKNA